MGIGLIQGGVLEPKLWNIGYEEVLKKCNSEEMLNKYYVYLWKKEWLSNKSNNKIYFDKKINFSLYADDKNNYARYIGNIQTGINLANDFVKDNERILIESCINTSKEKECIKFNF